MSKDKLIKTYHAISREYLHTGSIKDAVTRKDRDVDFTQLDHIWKMFWALLAVHKIKIFGSGTFMVVKLKLSPTDHGGASYMIETGPDEDLPDSATPWDVERHKHALYLRDGRDVDA